MRILLVVHGEDEAGGDFDGDVSLGEFVADGVRTAPCQFGVI